MNFKQHSELKGKHAMLSPSGYSWVNWDDAKVEERYFNSYATQIGTALHELAETAITNGLQIKDEDTNLVLFKMISAGIPTEVIAHFDLLPALSNLQAFVNDALAYGMKSEQILYYSDIAFGTADAIEYYSKSKLLRIHDYKSGITPAHIEQLRCYAALFCLEYKKNPEDISIELRLYQSGEVLIENPDPNDIRLIMDRIVTATEIVKAIRGDV